MTAQAMISPGSTALGARREGRNAIRACVTRNLPGWGVYVEEGCTRYPYEDYEVWAWQTCAETGQHVNFEWKVSQRPALHGGVDAILERLHLTYPPEVKAVILERAAEIVAERGEMAAGVVGEPDEMPVSPMNALRIAMGDKRPDLGEPWATRSPAEKAHDEALLADLRRMVVGSEGPLSPWEIDSMADQRVGLVDPGSRARYGIEHASHALKSAAASARGG